MRRFAAIAALVLRVAFASAQQPLDPAHYPTLAAMFAACPSACIINATSPRTFPDHGIVRVPAQAQLTFTTNGRWSLPEATLDFASAAPPQAPATQIFDGPRTASHLTSARPEWFSQPQAAGIFPPQALASAYAATSANAKILLQASSYISPFITSQYTSPRVFVGSGQPSLDTPADPKALVHGTILLGSFIGSAALSASNLGFDNGPAVTHLYFSDQKGYGLFLHGNGQRDTTSGTRLTNIAVLTTDAPSQHSVLLEGQRDIRIENLDLTTLGGTHGLILKSSDVTLHNFHCTGAASDCLLIKSDYATDHDGLAENLTLDGITITALHHPGDTGGVVIDSRWDSVTALTLRNLTEQSTSYGIAAIGSWFHPLRKLAVDQWNATGITGPCLSADHADGVTLAYINCSETPSPNLPRNEAAFILRGTHYSVTQGTITCVGQCALRAAVLDLDPDIAKITGVTATGFGAGLISRAAPPDTWSSRKLTFKEHARIVVTTLTTRCASSSLSLKLTAIVGFILLAFAMMIFRKRRMRSRT